MLLLILMIDQLDVCDKCRKLERHHIFGGGMAYLFCEACETTIYSEAALKRHNKRCYLKLNAVPFGKRRIG
jgi:hypothetical protein